MKFANSLLDLIGNTPLLKLNRYMGAVNAKANIFAKLEYFNPLGSIKDRAALCMIEDAISSGVINAQTILIEPTSGNTGIGLAYIAALKGMQLILTMPETMSIERRSLLAALGARIVLTDGVSGMSGAIAKAKELQADIPDSHILQQFENPANPEAHRRTTAPEIIAALDGNIDALVAGVGTGGTITGMGEVLKEQIPFVKIIAVEPAGSPVLTKGISGTHGLQGIGANFVPKILNRNIIDEIIAIEDDEAYAACRALAKNEGLLVGISSGAAVAATTKLAVREDFAGKNIVVILPDTGERYISAGIYM